MARNIATDETGLTGRRLIIADGMPTSDSGNPQEDFFGHPAVISLDDTPSVFLNPSVHREDDPRITGLISITQLRHQD